MGSKRGSCAWRAGGRRAVSASLQSLAWQRLFAPTRSPSSVVETCSSQKSAERHRCGKELVLLVDDLSWPGVPRLAQHSWKVWVTLAFGGDGLQNVEKL